MNTERDVEAKRFVEELIGFGPLSYYAAMKKKDSRPEMECTPDGQLVRPGRPSQMEIEAGKNFYYCYRLLPESYDVFTRRFDTLITTDDTKRNSDYRRKRKDNVRLFVKRNVINLEGDFLAMAVFPEELWKMMVDKMSPLDRLSICHSSPQLEKAFGPGKCEWLFESILPFILTVSFANNRLMLLTCRLVCKIWRSSVDEFLSTGHPALRPCNPDDVVQNFLAQFPKRVLNCSRLCFTTFSLRSIPKMLSCPSTTYVRSVIFSFVGFQTRHDLRVFIDASIKFLKLNGSAVKNLVIIQNSNYLYGLKFYSTLVGIINLVPNLNCLTIKTDLLHGKFLVHQPDLTYKIRESPIPIIPSIHSVVIEGLCEEYLNHFLERYASRLRKVSIDACSSFDYNFVSFSNLEELKVFNIFSDDCFRKLSLISIVTKKVKKISLDMSCSQKIRPPAIFDYIIQFSNLAHLDISFNAAAKFAPIRKSNLKLPSITTLQVEGDGRGIFYLTSCLLSFPQMKNLHIRDTSFPGNCGSRSVREFLSDDDDIVEIEKYIYNKNIHLSPIWGSLPALKIITYDSLYGSINLSCNRARVDYFNNLKINGN